MQFLKILFWCLLSFVAAIFTYGNWTTVQIKLWGGVIAEVNLPMLLLVTFLIGLLPTMLYYTATRWRLRQRLATAQRAISDLREATMPPPALAPAIAVVPAPTAAAAVPPIALDAEPVLPLAPPNSPIVAAAASAGT